MPNTLRFKPSVLFGTHTLLDKSLTVLQLPTDQPDLTANGQQSNSRLYSLGCKLIKVGSILHFQLLKETHIV